MGKLGVAAIKYTIRAKIDTNGIVEKPDVIGAIFGQTEGLLGEELDLRELQKGGRIGRIEVNVTSQDGKSSGTIEIPTSLSKEDTALIAAALETIDRIGPCDAKIKVEVIEDIRSSKRDFVVDRAKELLERMGQNVPESQELSEKVREQIRTDDVIEYGPDKLPAGPDIALQNELILVEGRADVINLLRHGISNVIGLGGTSIPPSIKEICQQKHVTAFLDGDRGGDLILKEIIQLTEVDFIARAPPGREVEELTQKEILKCIRNKLPVKEALRPQQAVSEPQVQPIPRQISFSRPIRTAMHTERTFRQQRYERPIRLEYKPEYKILAKIAESIMGTGQVCLLKQHNNNFREVGKIPKSDLSDVLNNLQEGKVHALVIDGDIDQTIVSEAGNKGIKYLIGGRKTMPLKRKPGMLVLEISTLQRLISENMEQKTEMLQSRTQAQQEGGV